MNFKKITKKVRFFTKSRNFLYANRLLAYEVGFAFISPFIYSIMQQATTKNNNNNIK
jgi:hypothetical protein